MEREKRNKRAREGGTEETKDSAKNAKKLDDYYYDKENSFNNNFHDDLSLTTSGIFDFPWLKEGMIFKSDDNTGLEEFENAFPTAPATGLESPRQFFCQSTTTTLQNFNDNNKFEDDEDELCRSFQVDEFDGADWIWSSLVLDQPPLAIGFNKV